MSGMWDRTLVYLGLREEPDEAYDELPDQPPRFDADDDPHAEHAPPRPSRGRWSDEAKTDAPADRQARGERESADRGRSDRERRTGHDREARGGASQDREAATVRPVRREEASESRAPARERATSNVTRLPTGDVHVLPGPGSSARAQVVRVTRFDDVEEIGRRYRVGEPVVFDLTAVDATTARRAVDFVSGLVYALRGRLEKVGRRAFLVVPTGAVLSTDEQRRLRGLGYRLSSEDDA
jgi:cell division inhibitor SepF